MTPGRLAYGVCAGPSDQFDRWAGPSIAKVDPGAPLLLRHHQSSIHVAYNSMIEEALELGAAGLVLLHDDAAIRRPDAATYLLELFSDPEVGVVGAVGAAGVLSAEWWWYGCHGRVEEPDHVIDCGTAPAVVDVVDGVMLALSGQALSRLRFDPSAYPPFHGYDLHICSLAQSQGLQVVAADFDLYHDSYPHGKITDPDAHRQADRVWRKRWRPGPGNALRYRRALLRSDWCGPRERLARVLRA